MTTPTPTATALTAREAHAAWVAAIAARNAHTDAHYAAGEDGELWSCPECARHANEVDRTHGDKQDAMERHGDRDEELMPWQAYC